MLTAFILRAGGDFTTEADAASLTAAMRDPHATFWLDMEKPTDEELALLDDVFCFHPLAIEDTIAYNQRPKIESYDHPGGNGQPGYFYMVIHAPDLATFREHVRTKELDIFVSERYLVTIHEEKMSSVEHVRTRCAGNARHVLEQGIDILLHNILDHLVDQYQPILEHLQESIENLEDEAVANPTPAFLSQISTEKRELLGLRRVIGPQRDVIALLSRGEVPFIRESCRVYFRDVQDHLVRAVEMIELYRELIVSARDLYLSSINNNLNQIMKTLTIVTVITAVLNVVTGFFGMNIDIPGLHSTLTFWITLVAMIGVTAGSITLFRAKRWI